METWQEAVKALQLIDVECGRLLAIFEPFLTWRPGLQQTVREALEVLTPLDQHKTTLEEAIATHQQELTRLEATMEEQRQATTRGVERLRNDLATARAAQEPERQALQHALDEEKRQLAQEGQLAREVHDRAMQTLRTEHEHARTVWETERQQAAETLRELQAQVQEAETRLDELARIAQRGRHP